MTPWLVFGQRSQISSQSTRQTQKAQASGQGPRVTTVFMLRGDAKLTLTWLWLGARPLEFVAFFSLSSTSVKQGSAEVWQLIFQAKVTQQDIGQARFKITPESRKALKHLMNTFSEERL